MASIESRDATRYDAGRGTAKSSSRRRAAASESKKTRAESLVRLTPIFSAGAMTTSEVYFGPTTHPAMRIGEKQIPRFARDDRESARDDRERARDDGERARDDRERARDDREKARDDRERARG
jgi:hypothetical protein